MHQSDVLFLAPRSLQRLGIAQSGLDPVVAHQVNMDICHAFFKRHLLQGKILLNLDYINLRLFRKKISLQYMCSISIYVQVLSDHVLRSY